MRTLQTRWRAAIVALVLGGIASQGVAQETSPHLWYDAPASKWTEALPVGNGVIGGMIFGGVSDEHIQFNEDTLWTGHPHDYARPDGSRYLPEIQKLIFAGNIPEAEAMVRQRCRRSAASEGVPAVQDLYFHFDAQEHATHYRRELNLHTAIHRVTYTVDGVDYTRDVFVSNPDHVMVIRYTASRPASISFAMKMTSPHKDSHTAPVATDTLALSGQVETEGEKFESRVRVMPERGSFTVSGSDIQVTKADAVTLVLAAATSFRTFQDITAHPEERNDATLRSIGERHYYALLKAHEADYEPLFDRVSLVIGGAAKTAATQSSDEPTNVRLNRLKNAGGIDRDPALAALYFQYGRYLLISSSRPGGQPANLQGIWNDQLNPPWESKWTTNINVEMNYWPAEVTNLSECHQPLFDMIQDLVISGDARHFDVQRSRVGAAS